MSDAAIEKKTRFNEIAVVANQGPQLKTMADVWSVAQMYHAAGMMPQNVKTAQQLLVILMAGSELGFGPTWALRNIAAFNGQALLHSDGPISLVMRSGQMEWQRSGFEGKDGSDGYTAWFEVKRLGVAEPVRRTFSVGEAKTASLWGKAIWKQYPTRMLLMRARAYALRDLFADVLGGFGILEERLGGEAAAMADETPTTGSAGLLAALTTPEEPVVAPGSSDVEPVDAEWTPTPEELEAIRERELAEAQGLFGGES